MINYVYFGFFNKASKNSKTEYEYWIIQAGNVMLYSSQYSDKNNVIDNQW